MVFGRIPKGILAEVILGVAVVIFSLALLMAGCDDWPPGDGRPGPWSQQAQPQSEFGPTSAISAPSKPDCNVRETFNRTDQKERVALLTEMAADIFNYPEHAVFFGTVNMDDGCRLTIARLPLVRSPDNHCDALKTREANHDRAVHIIQFLPKSLLDSGDATGQYIALNAEPNDAVGGCDLVSIMGTLPPR